MTGEEAIKNLQTWLSKGTEGMTNKIYGYLEGCFHEKDKEAFNMAIKALEQESCGDTISREVACKFLTKARMINDSRPMEEIFAEIPSVTPEEKVGHWIGKKLVNDNWIDYVAPLDDEGYSTDECRCSECGDTLAASDEYACRGYYCPNCGARMESKG